MLQQWTDTNPSVDVRLWRLLLRIFADDRQLRVFLEHGPESREIVPELPGIGASQADVAMKAITLLSERGTLSATLERLAEAHRDCSHSAELVAVRSRLAGDADGASLRAKAPPNRVFLTSGVEIDILPYIDGCFGLSRFGARLVLGLHGSVLNIDAFPRLIRRGSVVHTIVSHDVSPAAAEEPLDEHDCEAPRRSTYSYYPRGRGKDPAFDITLNHRVLLIDGPTPTDVEPDPRTLVVELQVQS